MDKTEVRREIEQGETFVFGEKNLIHEKLNNVTSYVKKSRVLVLIDQLDEPKPEVLIAERRVIKEPEKVVIPQFVADWIKRQLAYGYENVFIAMNRVMGGGSDRLINWFDSNTDTFARAWLDGYTVEKKRYYVVDKDGCAILKRNTDREFFKQVAYPENGKLKSYYIGDEDYMFTEKEIKDYDERYLPFAKKVKEDMEEK